MNELCRFYEPNLTLFAEGELRDDDVRTRLETHLLQCPDCREWLEDYRAFTQNLQLELGSSEDSSERDFVRTDMDFELATLGSVGSGDSTRIDKIMMRVRRQRRPATRFLPRFLSAAACLVALLLAGLFWMSREESRSDFSATSMQPISVSHRSTLQPVTAHSEIGAPVEIISWLLGESPEAKSRDRRDDVQLLGVSRKYGRDEDGEWFLIASSTGSTEGSGLPVRWVMTARLSEEFLDPVGGGWTFLVPDRSTDLTDSGIPDGAIPLRRLNLRDAPIDGEVYSAADGERKHYRIMVVPDERGLSDDRYYRPVSTLPGGGLTGRGAFQEGRRLLSY